MSIKIYKGFRCPIAKFPDMLTDVRIVGLCESATFVRRLAKHSSYAEALTEAKKLAGGHAKMNAATWHKRQRLLAQAKYVLAFRDICKPQSSASCSANVWFHGKYAYTILYGELWPWDYVPYGSEDFSYWNNTDKPARVSQRQWKARAKIWTEVCLDNWDEKRLVHTIVNTEERQGLIDMCRYLPNYTPKLVQYYVDA